MDSADNPIVTTALAHEQPELCVLPTLSSPSSSPLPDHSFMKKRKRASVATQSPTMMDDFTVVSMELNSSEEDTAAPSDATTFDTNAPPPAKRQKENVFNTLGDNDADIFRQPTVATVFWNVPSPFGSTAAAATPGNISFNNPRNPVCRSGYAVDKLKSLLQKAIRNDPRIQPDYWQAAVIVAYECVSVVNVVEAASTDTSSPLAIPSVLSAARATFTVLLHRLLKISTEDVMNPPLTMYILSTLHEWTTGKTKQTFLRNDQWITLLDIIVAMCFSDKFRASILSHAYWPPNHAIAASHGLDFTPLDFCKISYSRQEIISMVLQRDVRLFGLVLPLTTKTLPAKENSPKRKSNDKQPSRGHYWNLGGVVSSVPLPAKHYATFAENTLHLQSVLWQIFPTIGRVFVKFKEDNRCFVQYALMLVVYEGLLAATFTPPTAGDSPTSPAPVPVVTLTSLAHAMTHFAQALWLAPTSSFSFVKELTVREPLVALSLSPTADMLGILQSARYQLVIPDDSIVNDKHTRKDGKTTNLTAEGGIDMQSIDFFRAHSIVQPLFAPFAHLHMMCQPIYQNSLFT